MPKIVCISDTHEKHRDIIVPDGDILIHAGDFTGIGSPRAVADFNRWLGTLPHTHKVIIAGNHERTFENNPDLVRGLITNAIYLENTMVEVMGLKIWGSPYTPKFYNWAFMRERGEDIKRIWDQVPEGIDILVTHGGPKGCLDLVETHGSPNYGENVGCEELLKAIERIKPKLHVFGHIHESYATDIYGEILLVNASICDEYYRPVNKPIVVEVEDKKVRVI